MFKRCILLAIVLVLFSSFVYSAETGGCSKDGKCFKECIGGDSDCECAEQNGYVCIAGQECNGDLLRNWGDSVCCSFPCVNSVLTDGNSNVKSLEEIANNSKNETVIGSTRVNLIPSASFQFSFVLLLLGLIAFAWIISFSLHHFGDEVAFAAKVGDMFASGTKEYIGFLKYEFNKGEDFFKKEAENVKKISAKKGISKKTAVEKTIEEEKIVKLNPLILKILDTLTGDEEEMFKLLLDNEGIKKDDLRDKLGFDRIKFEQALLKLDRKQIITKKGPEDNPRIYVHDWLK